MCLFHPHLQHSNLPHGDLLHCWIFISFQKLFNGHHSTRVLLSTLEHHSITAFTHHTLMLILVHDQSIYALGWDWLCPGSGLAAARLSRPEKSILAQSSLCLGLLSQDTANFGSCQGLGYWHGTALQIDTLPNRRGSWLEPDLDLSLSLSQTKGKDLSLCRRSSGWLTSAKNLSHWRMNQAKRGQFIPVWLVGGWAKYELDESLFDDAHDSGQARLHSSLCSIL